MERSGELIDIIYQQPASLVKSMTHSQESRVSSSQDILRLTEENFSSVSALVNKLNSCTNTGGEANDDEKSGKVSATSNQEEKILESTFPWIRSFGDLCRTSLGNKSIKILENLLTVYLQHVSIDVKSCYMKPNRAAKLKKCMNEALLFFHMFYQDVREPIEHSFYLSKMTDLMSMYLDMEIIASRRKKETTKKVASRLTSSLYIFLDHSEHHMLDAILKAKLITKPNKEICTPVIGKLMNSLRLVPLYELLYVRCVLVFKLWKKLIKDAEEKKRITGLALKKLPVAKNFLDKSKLLVDVLPRIPKTKKNITMFFMQAKFNIKLACKAFMKMCKESDSLGDKSLFYGDLEDSMTVIGDKAVEVGGGKNTSLFNNIWSSISVVTDSSELNALTGNKEKSDALTGKKEKKKLKNKSKDSKNTSGSPEEKSKKKKKVKKKSISDDSISVIECSPKQNIQSVSLSGKEVKKKKKKLPLNDGGGKTATSNNSVDEQLAVVIKTEKNVQDTPTEISKEVEGQRVNQVNEINSVGYLNEVVSVELKDDEENDSLPIAVPVVVEPCRAVEASDSLEQVNQVNSMSSESRRVESLTVESTDKVAESVSEVVRQLDVNVTECVTQEPERSLTPATCSNEVAVSVEGVNSVICESVIVTSSNNTSLVDCLVNTSHNSQPTAIIENEAVPSVISGENTSITDMVPPKIVQTYVSAETSDDNEVTNIVSPREVIPPDSSIQLEDQVQVESCVGSVSAVIAEEGCSGVDDTYFNRMCLGYDSDEDILSDLRRQRTIPEDGEQDLSMPRNERDLLPRDTVPNNIFNTENSEVLFEVLTGGSMLPVSHLDLNSRVLCSEDGQVESPFLCVGDEGTELGSPPIEPISENEKHSLECIISNIRSSKDTGSFEHYGGGRQDWSQPSSKSKCMCDDCDKKMFSEITQSRYTSVVPAHENILTTDNFMDNDDDDDDRVISSDDEADSPYEYNSSSSSCSPQMKARGGKVGSQNFATLDTEKDALNSSSSISDSPPSLKSVYIDNESSYRKSNSGISPFSRRDGSNWPRVGEKIPAPFLVTSTHISPITTSATNVTSSIITSNPAYSTLKTVNVNLSDCLDTSINSQKKTNRTPKYSTTNSGGGYRDTTVNVSQNRYPDVVRDAHEATVKVDKSATSRTSPQKSSRSTVSSESGNNVSGKSVNCTVEGLYRNVPSTGSRCIPPSIPYPNIPPPAFVGKMHDGCTCSLCYYGFFSYLNYNSTHGTESYTLPSAQYNNSQTRTDMEIQKSEDDELLRKIEASLAEFNCSKSKSDSKEVESKYKPKVDFSLPLKKRLKTLPPIEEPKIKSGLVDMTKSSQVESFPSYPSRPMISIAELELHKATLKKIQQVPKSAGAPVACMQKYPPFNSSDNYYSNAAQQQSRENYMKRIYGQQLQHCPRYPIVQTDMPKGPSTCKVEGSNMLYNPVVNGMPALNSGNNLVDIKPVINNGLISQTNENVGIGFPNNYSVHKSNVPPHFKTPGQLKEIVPTTREYNMLKSEFPKTPMPPLIPIDSDFQFKFPAPKQPYVDAKQESTSIPTQINNSVEVTGKQNVLDLSKQSSKENKSRQNTRKRRTNNNSTSEAKPRNSKRSKRQTVIQNSDGIYENGLSAGVSR